MKHGKKYLSVKKKQTKWKTDGHYRHIFHKKNWFITTICNIKTEIDIDRNSATAIIFKTHLLHRQMTCIHQKLNKNTIDKKKQNKKNCKKQIHVHLPINIPYSIIEPYCEKQMN